MIGYYPSRPLKSKTTAILFALFFGPFGLFYVSTYAALMMLIGIPILAAILFVLSASFGLLLFSGGIASMFFIFCAFYWPICMIWASIAVDKYNRKIHQEDYFAQQHTNNTQQQFISTSTELPSNQELSEKKAFLQTELLNLKSQYERRKITEVEYVNKKEKLEKQIEIITHNLSFAGNAPSAYEHYINEDSEKKNYSYLLILLLAALIPLSLIGYQKGWFFDTHAKDKSLIKEQIEKTYFGMANGAYTSATIQGIGAEGLPFYNINFSNVAVMGLAPLANIFGYKVQMEPKNIDVYNFIDDNTAQVKYDLLVQTGNDTNFAKIDMIVKKVSGYWKLDGETFFGKNNKNNANESKRNTVNDPHTELGNDLKNSKTEFWKVTGENIQEGDSINLISYARNLIYAVSEKMVYEISDGYISNKWKILSEKEDIEGYFYTLDNDYSIYLSGFFVLAKNKEMIHSFDVEKVNRSNVDLSRVLETER